MVGLCYKIRDGINLCPHIFAPLTTQTRPLQLFYLPFAQQPNPKILGLSIAHYPTSIA